jgi:hypothetical protein
LLIITREKGVESLVGTRLLRKVGLLAKVLVITMVLTSVQILFLLRCHRLNLVIRHKGLGLHHIQGFWEVFPLVDPMGIGVEPFLGFHWLWKGLPLV